MVLKISELYPKSVLAANASTVTSSFNSNLSAADPVVQSALETLDDKPIITSDQAAAFPTGADASNQLLTSGRYENDLSAVVDATRLQSATFTGFDISKYYEGDMCLVRVDGNSIGSADIIIMSLGFRAAHWTHGEHLNA